MQSIIDLYENGMSIRKIAKLKKRDPKTISKILHKNNVKIRMPKEGIDISGKKFNELTVIKKNKVKRSKKCFDWFCLCSCGKECVFPTHEIIHGKRKMCNDCSKHKASVLQSTGYKDISGKYFSSLKKGADQRGLEFLISIEDIWNLYLNQNKKCALTGWNISFSGIGPNKVEQTASVDRIKNKKGYLKSNIQIVHKDINSIKSNFDNEYFIKVCKDVSIWT